MKTAEKKLIQERLDECQNIIKEQEKLPKSQRNMRLVRVCKQKSKTYHRWLKE